MSEHQIIDPSPDVTKITLLGKLKGFFLAGILVTAPISITVYVTWGFLNFLDSKITPLIPAAYNPNTYLPFSMPGLGLLIAVIFFISVGFITRNFLGRLLVRVSEYIVERLPVISTIYGAVKQIFETVMASQSDAFKEVVMFEYPRKGLWVMGFVTGQTKGEVQALTSSEVVNVFLPTTPNPTSGFLLFVPKKDLTFMKMGVEEGIKMIVSGGIITPPEPEPEDILKKKKLKKK
ncbi:MAG: DUF502 domain-containing protein [Alphaproteobacteria bacterium]|nr:DUF502 domain-containing protein [Alphaproteobacteria bacterium]NCQ87694.1 DUF502 domain-containing protein [Alphaproteobacteria bacterium]NCT05797.1 DUF502 domain-containing protein [Alphaproteobacteria bacterium]